MKYITFKPIYQERVWGGTGFAAHLGRELPNGKVIGESWEIVDRPEAQSMTEDGRSLRELINEDPKGIMGANWTAERPFPILVKWLDCQEKLSLQVHPPAFVAGELGGEPKTENWYIAHAEPHATLMAGLKDGVTQSEFKAGLNSNQLEPLIHSMNVSAGESIFIPSGRIHAIGGGNLILEIQQNSDTTYRVYDWGRVGLDGKPREIHIKESLKSTDFDDFEPETLKPKKGNQLLAKCNVFNLRKIQLETNELLSFEPGQARILSVVNGQLQEADSSEISRGTNALLPARERFRFRATSPCEILLTENFAHPDQTMTPEPLITGKN